MPTKYDREILNWEPYENFQQPSDTTCVSCTIRHICFDADNDGIVSVVYADVGSACFSTDETDDVSVRAGR